MSGGGGGGTRIGLPLGFRSSEMYTSAASTLCSVGSFFSPIIGGARASPMMLFSLLFWGCGLVRGCEWMMVQTYGLDQVLALGGRRRRRRRRGRRWRADIECGRRTDIECGRRTDIECGRRTDIECGRRTGFKSGRRAVEIEPIWAGHEWRRAIVELISHC
jgi:hypothetical protein